MIEKWLGDRNFWRVTLRLALPVALQTLLTSSFSMVDTIMVGQLGEVSLAAVGMAGQWSWLMSLFMFGISSGSAVFIAQYWGVKDHDGISRTYGMVMINSVGIALVFTAIAYFAPHWVLGLFTEDAIVIAEGTRYLQIACLSYLGIGIQQAFSTVLRSTEDVRLPVYTALVAVVTNVLLNYVLIFGKFGFPELGVAGSAIATAIAATLNPLLMLFISLRKRNILIVPIRKMVDFSRPFIVYFFKLSLPVLINESLWAMGTLGYNMVYGHMGTGNYSALTIFRTVEGIAFVFFIGMCSASAVMVGKSIGAGKLDRAKGDSRRFGVLVPGLALLVGIIMIACRVPIVSLFNITDEVRNTAMWLLVIYGLELPLRNIPYIFIVGIFRAGGDTRTGMIYDVACVWFIALPMTILCGLVFHLPFLLVVVIMLLSEDVVKSILCIRRYRSGKWVMPVTETGKQAIEEGS